MKILFFSSALTGGGAERVLTIVANALVDNGHQVYIATDLRYPIAFSIDKRVQLENYRKKDPKLFGSLQSIRLLSMLRQMRKLTTSIKPDVVVSFQTSMNIFTLLSLIGKNFPVIVCEHTNVRRKIPMSKLRPIFYPFASAVTVLTKSDYLYCRNNWRNKNVVYMPNPYIVKELSNNSATRENVILAVGRVNSWKVKGFDNLIKCWSTIWNKHKNWKLRIVGKYDDDSLNYLYNIIKQTNCGNVEFLGFRSDIDELLRTSKVFVLSSRAEGLPMSLLEAMAAGCCCVSYDVVTGPNEIISDGVDGILVDNQNLEQLSHSLDEVMTDDNLLNKLAKHAPSALNRYSLERVMRRWYLLFSKVTTNN